MVQNRHCFHAAGHIDSSTVLRRFLGITLIIEQAAIANWFCVPVMVRLLNNRHIKWMRSPSFC
ncbi:hypothetical protein KCP75_04445 [Salmonella enterica subsp. enterica]|nr:hypothetical protein KCP75_04445 [Salmonella enterica subsp. enterica]